MELKKANGWFWSSAASRLPGDAADSSIEVLPENLRTARASAGIKAGYVETFSDIPESRLRDIENGNDVPTLRELIILSRMYEVSMDEILGLPGYVRERKKRPADSEICSVTDFADAIGVNRRTVDGWTRLDNPIPFVRIEGSKRKWIIRHRANEWLMGTGRG